MASCQMEKSSYVDAEDGDSFIIVDEENTAQLQTEMVMKADLEEDDGIQVLARVEDAEYVETVESLGDENENKDGEDVGNKFENENVQQEIVSEVDSTSDNALLDMSLYEILAQEKENLQLQAQKEQMKNIVGTFAKFAEGKGLPQKSIDSVSESTSEAPQSSQNALGGLTNAFRTRRRRNMPRSSKDGSLNVQQFIQDYYKSLNTVSCYIICACLLGFGTAFCLLSWYSAQTHGQDMQLFELKEREALNKQSILERMQGRYESFRETLIHQRYEETRECHNTLKSCYSGKEEFLARIAKLEEDATQTEAQLMVKLENLKKENSILHGKIRDLNERNKELVQANKELRAEIGQSFSSIYAQILIAILNLLKNKGVQVFIFGVAVVGFIPIIFTSRGSRCK